MKKWSMLISLAIIISMVTIIILTNREFKKEAGEMDGYSSAMIEDLPNDEVKRIPEDWKEETTSEDTASEETGLGRGDLAPDFELTTLTGETVKLSDYRGKKIMLNFWASWCPPCRSEMPHMETYYDEYKDTADMEILAVNMTRTEKDKEESAKAFVEEFGLTFPVLLDLEGKVMKMYRVKAYPTTYILNTEGVITDIVISAIDDKFLKKLIDESN